MLFASSAALLAACSSSAAKTADAAETVPVQQNAVPTTAPTEAQAAAAEVQPAATTAAENTAAAGESPAAAALDQDAAALELLSLSLGSIKLISTGAAITKDQAAVLIPLWQEYQALTESMRPADPGQTPDPAQAAATPAAPVENTELLVKLNDLVVRIQAAMTAEQLQAIKDMNITQDTMQALLQELGIELGGPGGGQGGGGQPPQGDGPATDGQQPQGAPPAGDASGYPAEGDGARPGGGGMGAVMIPTGLVEKLIEALQAIP